MNFIRYKLKHIVTAKSAGLTQLMMWDSKQWQSTVYYANGSTRQNADTVTLKTPKLLAVIKKEIKHFISATTKRYKTAVKSLSGFSRSQSVTAQTADRLIGWNSWNVSRLFFGWNNVCFISVLFWLCWQLKNRTDTWWYCDLISYTFELGDDASPWHLRVLLPGLVRQVAAVARIAEMHSEYSAHSRVGGCAGRGVSASACCWQTRQRRLSPLLGDSRNNHNGRVRCRVVAASLARRIRTWRVKESPE